MIIVERNDLRKKNGPAKAGHYVLILISDFRL